MKRRLVMILTAVMITSLTACGSPSGDTNVNDKESKVEDTVAATEQAEEPESEVAESETIETEVVTEDTETTEAEQESETEEEKKVEESDEKDSDKKDSDKKDSDKKDTDKKDTDKKDSDSKNSGESSKKPNKTKKPAKKPNKTEKPSKKPQKDEKPEDTEKETNEEQKKETVANTLMSDFKSIAKSQNAESIANQLIANKIIPFMPAVMPVEEGWLNGFGDAEITGFKEGAMFGPMIGTIPFIGYVFELKDETDVNQFISTLKSNANLRWNICTEADEMVVCSVDKKVFFVMCPKYFEE